MGLYGLLNVQINSCLLVIATQNIVANKQNMLVASCDFYRKRPQRGKVHSANNYSKIMFLSALRWDISIYVWLKQIHFLIRTLHAGFRKHHDAMFPDFAKLFFTGKTFLHNKPRSVLIATVHERIHQSLYTFLSLVWRG